MTRIRGSLHVHSCYSYDCNVPLREIQLLAERTRLSFIVQTEHSNHMTSDLYARYREEVLSYCTPRFLFVPGIEYASANNRIHILVFGLDIFWEDLKLFPEGRLLDLLDRVRAEGGIAILAHPERADVIDSLPEHCLSAIDCIEVWNRKTDRWGPSPRSLAVLRRLGRAGISRPATAGLDLHRIRDFRSVGIELAEMPANQEALVDRIRRGRFSVFFGPLRWNVHDAGRMSYCTAVGLRWALQRARRIKAASRGLVCNR